MWALTKPLKTLVRAKGMFIHPLITTQKLVNMAMEIVDLPLKDSDFHSHTSLPELSDWWYTYPSENMKVNWDDYSQYIIEK